MTDLFSSAQNKALKKDQTIIDEYMTPPEYVRARKLASGYSTKVAMDTGKIDSFLINGRLKLKTEQADKYHEERAAARKRAS
jgi:hypothetical protein